MIKIRKEIIWQRTTTSATSQSVAQEKTKRLLEAQTGRRAQIAWVDNDIIDILLFLCMDIMRGGYHFFWFKKNTKSSDLELAGAKKSSSFFGKKEEGKMPPEGRQKIGDFCGHIWLKKRGPPPHLGYGLKPGITRLKKNHRKFLRLKPYALPLK